MMIITGSSLALESNHAQAEKYSKTENMQYWDQKGEVTLTSETDQLNISAEAHLLYLKDKGLGSSPDTALKLSGGKSVNASKEIDSYLSEEDKQKIMLLQKFIEAMSGKKFKFILLDRKSLSEGKCLELSGFNRPVAGALSQGAPAAQSLGWGFRYDAYERYEQYENTTFNAEGVVRTADGKEINISVSLSMSSSFISENHISIRAGDALKDPLVINFEGNAAQLTQQKYVFDLDSDGSAENMSFVMPGSGFLALDKNGDRVINDGSELIGALTGDGFNELAVYDQDGNNWIDENDPIYNNLRIWTKDETGKDTLLALGQQGIGAIYLGRTETPFDLKDSENALQGMVRTSGIYLQENGGVGTIQQVDLAV